jgi:hypothetical protein
MDRMDYLKKIVDNQKLIIFIICYKTPLMGIFGNGNNSFEPMVSKNDKLQGNIYVHVHELGPTSTFCYLKTIVGPSCNHVN